MTKTRKDQDAIPSMNIDPSPDLDLVPQALPQDHNHDPHHQEKKMEGKTNRMKEAEVPLLSKELSVCRF